MGEFNRTGNDTNFVTLKKKLARYGFSKEYVDNFKVVLWDMPNSYYGRATPRKFEGFADTSNLIHISGLDPAILAFLTGVEGQKGTPQTSEEMFLDVMNQEIFNYLEV